MSGEYEARPLTYRDEPAERTVRLFGPSGREYEAAELNSVTENFEALKTEDPETIKQSVVRVEPGRLAVGMTVYGDHATLHRKVPHWLSRLHAEVGDDPLAYTWQIGH